MVRIEVNLPYDVRELREEFELSGEADVRYPERFLIDSGVYTTFEVPIVAKERRVIVDDVTPIEDDTLSAVRPRICYYDIEVKTSDDGPAVVSEKGCEQTRNPITAIAAHDSYQDGKTRAWILEDGSWNGELTIPSNVTICETETELLEQFCQFLVDRRFDVLSGWNSSGFDDPYFVNRCLAKEITAVQHISPTKDVSRMNGNGQWRNSDLKGIILLDLLEAYKNVSRRKLSSYSLDAVAEGEGLDVQKMDVDEQTAYYEDPQTFIDYVRTDVDVLIELNKKKEII
jgi:DNA polymerase elongation subunit (family B)